MLNVFKLSEDGDWKTKCGKNYKVLVLSPANARLHVANGWYLSLDEAISAEPKKIGATVDNEDGESMSDYERELRDKIKALGGKAGGRAKIETLELTLAKLEEEQGE